jgi:hypothetical protein
LSQHTNPQHQAFCGVAASFFCHGFCSHTLAAHLFFLKDREKK